MGRWIVALGVAILCAACTGASTPPRSDGGAPTPTGASQSDRGAAVSVPKLIRSTPMGRTNVRLPVASADLRSLVRVRGNTIMALADDGAFFGEVYPAISYDDGGDWRIDGPRFYRAAASGPGVTTHLAVSADDTVVAWGRAGDLVKTTTDLGRRWYEATISGVMRVSVSGSRLVVRTFGTRSYGVRIPPQHYISRDDGRTWRLRPTTP